MRVVRLVTRPDASVEYVPDAESAAMRSAAFTV